MKKRIAIFTLVVMLATTGCAERKTTTTESTEEPTEITTEATTEAEEEPDKEVLASGNGKGEEDIQNNTPTNADIPDVLPAANDGRKFDPEYSGLSNYQGEFTRETLVDPIQSYMYQNDIKDNCTKVEILEYVAERNMYIINIYYDNHETTKVRLFQYSNDYHIYTYEEDEDVGYHEGQ